MTQMAMRVWSLTCSQTSSVWSQGGFGKHHSKGSWWGWWNSSWAISGPKRWCCESAAQNMWQQIWRNFSSDQRTGKGQFSLQFKRIAVPKNVQTAIQLLSFHMPAGWSSKSFKLGFKSTRLENIQRYRPGLEKAEKPEIKPPISVGSRKHPFLLH